VHLRGKATHGLEPIGCVSGPGGHARRSADRVFGFGRASPVDHEAGCSIRMRAVHRTWAEALVRHDATPQVTRQTHTSSQRASPEPEPKPGNGCFLDALRVTEATNAAPKLPFWRLTASRETLEGSIGERMSVGTSRSGCARAPSPGGCLPLAGHRSGTQAQDTQREIDDISLGVRILSTFEPGRSLCRFTSPTPSALRVSHSLSGLSPPGPRGFVSRHIRP
jgi:hypothetical protein